MLRPRRLRVRLTQELQLAPELALLAAHAVHGARDVVEVRLQLPLQLRAVLPLPQPPLLKGHRAGLPHCLAADLCTQITRCRQPSMKRVSENLVSHADKADSLR